MYYFYNIGRDFGALKGVKTLYMGTKHVGLEYCRSIVAFGNGLSYVFKLKSHLFDRNDEQCPWPRYFFCVDFFYQTQIKKGSTVDIAAFFEKN